MHVKALMIPFEQLKVLTTDQTAEEALNKIESADLLSLPVIDENQNFVGVLSKRYLYEAFYKTPDFNRDSFNKSLVKDYMREKLPVTELDIRIEEAALMLFEHRMQFLPIVDSHTKKLKGIITKNALLKQYKSIFGIKHPRIVLLVNDFKGKLADFTNIINRNGGNIRNIVQIDTDIPTLTEITLRIECNDIHKIERHLEQHGYEVREVSE